MKLTGKTSKINANKVASLEQIWQAHRNVYEKMGQKEWAEAIYEAYIKNIGINY